MYNKVLSYNIDDIGTYIINLLFDFIISLITLHIKISYLPF